MTPEQDMRTPLGRARGLGSAKQGTEHWWLQRLTALALIFLCGWFVLALLFCVHSGDYQAARDWLARPWNAAFMALLLGAGFHHAAGGLQVVIEDYVHRESVKIAAIIGVKFLSFLLAAIGLIAVGRIAFGG